jgi:DNA mismatch repair ATPase MutS
MKIKMKTNFKTLKFGMLENGKTYDLPTEDAEGLCRNKRAERTFEEPELSQDEIILKGKRDHVKGLKVELATKAALINANEKTKANKELKTKELQKLDAKIEEAQAEVKALEENTPKKKPKKKAG